MFRYAQAVRYPALGALLVLVSCSGPPAREVERARPDPAREPWFGQAVTELTDLNRQAAELVRERKFDEASALITKGQGLMARLLAVPRPSMDAVIASSDLDELYGRMLLANRHYGWARLQFQKNVARWKNWQPQTEDTVRRRKAAEALIAEADRRIERQ